MMEKKDALWLKSGCEGLTTSGDVRTKWTIGKKSKRAEQ